MEVDNNGLRLVDADGNIIPIKWGRYKKSDGTEEKVIFIGHEKAIYGADGVTLDKKLGDIKGDISDEFSEETDYLKGDYCIRDNKLYKFTEDKEAGAWDESSATKTIISEELKLVLGRLENIDFNEMNISFVANTDFQTKIKSIVKNGKMIPFVFYNTTNNPLSIGNGFGIAFYSGNLSSSVFVIAFNETKIETKKF